MAVTLDQTSIVTGAASAVGASTTFNTSAAIATDGMAAILVGRFNSGAVTATIGISGGGLTWVATLLGTSGSIKLYLCTALAPSGLASATTLTVTNSSGTADITVAGASYLGVASATPVAQNSAAASTAAWASGTVAAASGNALIGGAWGDGTLRTSTPTGPAVERVDFNSATTGESVTLIDKLSVAGSDSLAGTWSGTLAHVAGAAAFTAAAAAAVAPNTFMAPFQGAF